ncbi:MAG: peptide chain release factor 1, partial [uncultured bacterium]
MESYKQLKSRYEDLTHQLSTPDLSSDTQKYQKIAKEHAGLKETVEKIDELEKTEKDLAGAKELLEDPEMKEQAKKEIANLTKQKQELKKELEYALLPKNPNDSKDVIMEIRAGAGGNEAGLFAADLFRMYSKYAEDKSWKINLINSNRTGIGGFKEVIFEVKGDDVFKKMKYESGVHRVQRVPKTEKSGRVHTSTATVAVFPEAK